MVIRDRDTIETILLAKTYRIAWWLREGYMKIAQKVDLTIEDLRGPHKLDWETISRIFALHSILTKRAGERKNSRSSSRVMAQDVEKFTDSIFREEFSQMDQAQAEWEKCKCGVCRRGSSG